MMMATRLGSRDRGGVKLRVNSRVSRQTKEWGEDKSSD